MSTNCCGAGRLFNLKSAKKELKKYQRSGPGKATKKLIASIDGDLQEKSLLDIGGGIGAIQWSFLKKGGAKTSNVDYSTGYIQVAKSYADENGWSEKTSFHQGDFLEVSDAIGPHDFVTLDKVVCCYPDYQRLLSEALSKTRNTIGLVYPQDGNFSKFFNVLSSLYFRVTRNPFRTYIHPVEKMRDLITENNFKNIASQKSFPWIIEVYQRGMKT